MTRPILVGCIEEIRKSIFHTRFFYLDSTRTEARDVTEELCYAIDVHNQQVQTYKDISGGYAMSIPYTLDDGLATYSFGCGMTHYLQENVFEEIYLSNDSQLSFPLTACRLTTLAKDDLRNILHVKSVWDAEISDALLDYYKN